MVRFGSEPKPGLVHVLDYAEPVSTSSVEVNKRTGYVFMYVCEYVSAPVDERVEKEVHTPPSP